MADSGTDVSDVESTGSTAGFVPEQLKNSPNATNGANPEQHARNRTGTVVVNHRTNSSLGNHLDIVTRMVNRYGSMGDGELNGVIGDLDGDLGTDSDYEDDDDQKNGDKSKKKAKKTKRVSPNNKTNGNANGNLDPNAANANGGDAENGGTHRRKKSAADELKALQAEREALAKAFETYIDPEHNDDVDCDELIIGLQKLNVDMNETQMRMVYKFMDKEDNGFVDSGDFVTFATTRFDTEELRQLQIPILKAVRVQNLHDRTHSNLINPTLSQDWTDYDMHLLEQEMASAMTGMVEDMKEALTEEQEFEKTMNELLEKQPDQFKKENAFNWTKYETVHWILSLGMERYARYFAQESVDGPMLLEDMSQEMLETNLGVRTIHAKKIMREIYNLKKAVRGVTDRILDESDFLCTVNFDDIDRKIAQLQIKEQLEKTKKAKDELKKFYEGEIQKLNDIIVDLESGEKGKKKKKKKKGEKHKKTASISTAVPPQTPPSELPLMIGGAANVDEQKQTTDAKDDGDGDDDDDKDNEADDAEADEEEKGADSHDTAAKATEAEKEEEEEEDSDDDSDDDDDDEFGGKRLLTMSPTHLMHFKHKNKAPSAKQMSRFLKDLQAKKQQNADEFAITESDTIMEWTAAEVAYWMTSINFSQYAFSFYALPIDGDMLLRDMTAESLITDLGVKKIHSSRILRQIEKLRRVINEGFDEELVQISHILPDIERPTMLQIETLQDVVEKLQKERQEILTELEAKNDNDEEQGYFSKKIAELETERNEMKVHNEELAANVQQIKDEHEAQIENLNNTLNEANGSNDELRKEMKSLKKDLRKAQRRIAALGDDGDEDMMDDDDEDDEDEDNEAKKKEEEEMLVEITVSLEEVEQQIRKEMDENPHFGVEERVLEWSVCEVCHWLKMIQFGPYMTVFYSAQIFGDVLIQDIGQRMLRKFNVTQMHIPKLLRQISKLRTAVMDKGVRITLSEEIKNEMDPNYKANDGKSGKDKKGKKEKKVKGGKKLQELQKDLENERSAKDNLQKNVAEKDEQITNLEQQFEEEKQLRIGFELELEQIKSEFENMMKVGSKSKVVELENMISALEENKIRTVRDLNDELNALRIGCRLMQKEIAFLKGKQGFRPLDAFVGVFGYSAATNY